MAVRPAEWNWKAYPSQAESRTFTILGSNLSGATWLMEVRQRKGTVLILALGGGAGITAALVGSDTVVTMAIPVSTLSPMDPATGLRWHVTSNSGSPNAQTWFVGDFEIAEVAAA